MEDKKPPRARKRFPKIAPSAFLHPMDLKALEALKKVKGVDFLIRKVNEYGYERYLYINNIADNVRVTPLQCPKLHEMLVEACEIIDVDLPQLYLDQNPIANAMTFGTEKPFIIINSGIVDLLNDDELFTVIAHEVGHIKCGHVLYKMVAHFLRWAFGIIDEMTLGIGKFITGPLMVAFYEWDRKSELSADRAGLLCCQDRDVVINTLMKLAGGCGKLHEQMDKEQFLRQAEDYRELDTSTLNQFYKLLQVIFRTHPFPALRAKEIDAWARSTEYQNIMDGIYPRLDMDFYQGPGGNDFGSGRGPSGPPFTPPYTSPGGPPPGYSPGGAMTTCPNCDAAVEATATFCHMCGSTIVGAIAVIEKPPAGEARKTIDVQATTSPSSTTSASPKPDTKPRCHNCGTVIKRTDEYCPSCGLNTRMDW